MTLGRKTGGRKSANITHCIDCNEDLNINPKYTQGYRLSRCKDCYNKFCIGRYKDYNAEFRNKPENKQRKYERSIANQFGITLEDYNKLFEFQEGKCAICKNEPDDRRLDVDHNHTTGEIRGLLCKRCNVTIGQVEENPDIIQDMYDYLDRTTWSKGLEMVQIRGKRA